MKKVLNWKKISTEELAALIYQQLKENGIDAVLVGGSCVTIYSNNNYISHDLDYVSSADNEDIRNSLAKLGFERRGKYFQHPHCNFLVEMVATSVAIGDEVIKDFRTIKTKHGSFKLLKVEDCVKDRLASYFHWNDRQGLEQAIAVCLDHKVNLKKISEWAKGERHEEKFLKFKKELEKAKSRVK
ncbi:MAG: hypothetical protein ACHQT8_01330 [Chlamydiales bacterium]